MNTFAWLFVGHLVGDWVLQNDWMAKGKRQKLFTWAGTAHFAVYATVITSAFCYADAQSKSLVSCILVGVVAFVSHWLIDATSAARHWTHCCIKSKSVAVRTVVDQTFHLMILVALSELIEMQLCACNVG